MTEFVRSLTAGGVVLCISTVTHAQRNTIATERVRLAEITGDTIGAPVAVPSWLRIVPPDVRIVWNSEIPYSLNDGPLWAGRGMNVGLSGGLESSVRLRRTLVRVRLAPTMVYSQNLPFPIIRGTMPSRSAFANPLHDSTSSMDLPLRFGDVPVRRFDAGRSELSVTGRHVALRLTAENDWWGPAIRNAIVMGDNAAGIPRLEVLTSTPLRTRVGAISAKAIAGALTPSLYFDAAHRSRIISGAVIELKPKFDTTLTLGFHRVVYAPVAWSLGTVVRAIDFAVRWEALRKPSELAEGETDYTDQISALAARWIFPRAGFEVYGEWARADLPRSLNEFVSVLHYSGGYTFGFQWAQPKRTGSYLRLQSEITYLEQSAGFGDRTFSEFYSGRASAEGYTQRGQVIGAAIGPGASSQWLAMDYFAPRWQVGVFAGRVRWENDALYRQFVPNFFQHDVSLLGGVRGARRFPHADLSFDVTWAYRQHWLFQSGFANPGRYGTMDIRNLTLSVAATPR